MPMPTISWNVDANGDWATAADWSPGRLPGFRDDVAIDTAHPHRVTHAAGRDTVHTLTVGDDAFVVLGGTLTIRSASSFAGLLRVPGGTLALRGDATAASFSQGGLASAKSTVFGAGVMTVTGQATFNGDDAQQSGPGATVLEGASSLDDALGLDGGRTLENQGVFTLTGSGRIFLGDDLFGHPAGGAALVNDAGGTIDIRGLDDIDSIGPGASFVNAGLIEKTVGTGTAVINANFTDTGAIVIASGTLEFFNFASSASFAGSVSGAGTLAFSGGAQALQSGATLTVANWSLSEHAVTSVDETLTYAGAFSQGAGTTLAVAAGDTLRLTGAASLVGNVSGGVLVNGPGVVELSNATIGGTIGGTRGGLLLGGAVTLTDVGAVRQNGDVNASGAGVTLSIAAGATYSLENNSDIFRDSSVASTIRNSGLLIKSGGGGVSAIWAATTDDGAIEAASGTLAFNREITGAGTLAVDGGATLQVNLSAAATLAMSFDGGDAVLALGAPQQFAATIGGFAPGDAIDLLRTQATGATLGPGDTLTIMNGATTIATLQLTGNYAGATFNVAADGKGGTDVTVTTAPFVAAMAGFGGGAGGPVSRWFEGHAAAHHAALCAPRLAHFA